MKILLNGIMFLIQLFSPCQTNAKDYIIVGCGEDGDDRGDIGATECDTAEQ